MSKLSEEEREEMLRDARAKDELEKATIKLVARKEGIEEGKALGKEEGKEENKKTVAKTLYEMGMDKANIAKAIHIDVKDIDKYLE